MRKTRARRFLAFFTALILSVLAYTSIASLKEQPVSIVNGTSEPSVTVRYRGLNAARIELWVDGVYFTERKLLNGKEDGEALFVVDPAKYAVGKHKLETRVFDAENRSLGTAIGSIDIKINSGSPLAIASPLYNSEVNGTALIDVAVSSKLKKPYVSIFVNGKLRVVRNYPPYSYAWDTAREPNGWAEVQVMAFDETGKTYNAPTAKIYVNNVTGRTEREDQTVTADNINTQPMTSLYGNEPPVAMADNMNLSNGNSGMVTNIAVMPSELRNDQIQKIIADAKVAVPQLQTPTNSTIIIRPLEISRMNAFGQKMETPGEKPLAKPSVSKATAAVPTSSPILRAILGQTTLPVSASKAELPKDVKVEKETKTPVTKSSLPKSSTTGKVDVKAIQTGKVTKSEQPTKSVNTVKPVTKDNKDNSVKTAVKEPAKVSKESQPSSVKNQTKITGKVKTVQLNGKAIKFDVKPQVKKGKAMIPIRKVVEAAGGWVDWNNKNQLATLYTVGKEITLDFKTKTVKVNGSKVDCDFSAYVYHGRTMVSQEFITLVLEAAIKYEPELDLVLIEYKRMF